MLMTGVELNTQNAIQRSKNSSERNAKRRMNREIRLNIYFLIVTTTDRHGKHTRILLAKFEAVE